jgi:hypothetical protein
MKAAAVIKGLQVLETQLEPILDTTNLVTCLGKARKQLQEGEKMYNVIKDLAGSQEKVAQEGWGFDIGDPPLQFRETKLKGYRYRVDLRCQFRWKAPPNSKNREGVLSRSNVILRVWALDKSMIYREEWDAPGILELMNKGQLPGRVVMRFHFDKAEPGVSELIHHLQVAGVAEPDTYCWLHPQLEVPRFPYPPFDLFLVCELVGANFYPVQYEKIRTESTWHGQVLESQRSLYREYHEKILKAIENQSVLMGCLWQRAASAEPG